MTCPQCGHHYNSPQQTWQERQRALGRCVICGVPCDKWPAGTKRAGQFYSCCREHRLHNSKMAGRRYLAKTRHQPPEARRRISS